jgi:hypothetical protein
LVSLESLPNRNTEGHVELSAVRKVEVFESGEPSVEQQTTEADGWPEFGRKLKARRIRESRVMASCVFKLLRQLVEPP